MLKVGIINFINSYPLFYGLRTKKVPCSTELVYENPLYINEHLRHGEFDIALISSSEFLTNQSQYVLLSDLGVASTGPIYSVRLFYNEDPLCLENKTVLVPSVSTTSVRLLNCLLTNFWKAQPTIKPFTCPPEDLFNQNDPFLLIGDDCIRHAARKDIQSLDLGEAWNTATDKSLIYSLVATRVDVFKKKPHEVAKFHNELEQSFQWGRHHQKELIESACLSGNLPKKIIQHYFDILEHRLTSKHFQGLNYYCHLEV